MDLHIAERFLSVQGEGFFAGTPMFFIRTAGCSVGKPLPRQVASIPAYIEECATYDGRKFLCDTDFRRARSLSIDSVIADMAIGPIVKHVCITGGEPLNQQAAVRELIVKLLHRSVRAHIETSGTVAPEWLLDSDYRHVWVAVSPKRNVTTMMLHRADEIKLLVDRHFDLDAAERLVAGLGAHVYLQPVNGEKVVDQTNVQMCMAILRSEPTWKLSVQLHKFINVR